MTHDELLICVNMNAQTTGGLEQNAEALRAVVELHIPMVNLDFPYQPKCSHCKETYPCPTNEAIEKELK